MERPPSVILKSIIAASAEQLYLVIINGPVLQYSTRFLEQIRMVNQNCFGVAGPNLSSDSYVVAVVTGADPIDLDTLGTFTILSAASIVVNADVFEVYDVCTPGNYRRRGYANLLLLGMIGELRPSSWWLGVQYNQPLESYLGVISLYQKVGFTIVGSSIYTSAGVLAPPHVNLVRRGSVTTSNTSNQSHLASALYELYHSSITRQCTASFVIPSATLRNLAALTITDVGEKYAPEVGGNLSALRVSNQFVIQALDELQTVGGHNEVNFNLGPLSYHSHPRSAYEQLSVVRGWPSGSDFAAIVNTVLRGYPFIFHLVVAVEGLYMITLTQPFMLFLATVGVSQRSDLMTELSQAMVEAFGFDSSDRGTSINPVEAADLDRRYLNTVNSRSMEYLLQRVHRDNYTNYLIVPNNVRLFAVHYAAWRGAGESMEFTVSYPSNTLSRPPTTCLINVSNLNQYLNVAPTRNETLPDQSPAGLVPAASRKRQRPAAPAPTLSPTPVPTPVPTTNRRKRRGTPKRRRTTPKTASPNKSSPVRTPQPEKTTPPENDPDAQTDENDNTDQSDDNSDDKSDDDNEDTSSDGEPDTE
jgi:ribosomal protein S18 acetylase RimI-like enzyme